MQGYRNPVNRLWKVSLHTDNLKTLNYHLPALHTGLYPAQKTSVDQVTPSKTTVFQSTKPSTPKPCFSDEYGSMNNLIDDYEFDHLISQTLRNDRVSSMPSNYLNPFQSMNSIIDDNITHQVQILI